MSKVYVVTVPHSGTHFVEKMLQLLKVEFTRIHSTPENNRKLWAINGGKIVTTYRPTEDCAQSLYSRVVDFQRLPSEAAAMEAQTNYMYLRLFMQNTTLPKFGIYLNKNMYDALPSLATVVRELALFLGVEPTDEAMAYACMWPIESSFPHNPKWQSARLRTDPFIADDDVGFHWTKKYDRPGQGDLFMQNYKPAFK